MKFYKIISYLAASLFVLLGLLTIGSIINSTTSYHINLIMGVFFAGIGVYLYLKTTSVIKLITKINGNDNEKQFNSRHIVRFLLFENIFTITKFILGLISVVAVISRMFVEKLAVFG